MKQRIKSKFFCPKCRRGRNSRGQPFKSQEAADQHAKSCPGSDAQTGDPDFEMTNLLADDDMPDGAYFAMAWELGEL